MHCGVSDVAVPAVAFTSVVRAVMAVHTSVSSCQRHNHCVWQVRTEQIEDAMAAAVVTHSA